MFEAESPGNKAMNRRIFLGGAAAMLGLASFVPAAAAAAGFASRRIAIAVRGSGPDVILIPGLASSREIWSETAAALPGYRYHSVQVAGFAGWPAAGNAEGAVVAPVAEEIARYIRQAGLVRPALVGHSMGGTIAMMIAASHPALVGKLMVVDMLPRPAGLFGADPDSNRGLAEGLGDLTARPGGRALVSGLISLFAPQADQSGRSDPDVVARASRELALLDLGPQLARIAAPLTVVYAVPDPAARAETERTYRQAYRAKAGVKLVRIEDSGHMIMYDRPRRFREELAAFLSG
jgi:pimeloyl-ACP methyl ester carboxylesterase